MYFVQNSDGVLQLRSLLVCFEFGKESNTKVDFEKKKKILYCPTLVFTY